MSVKRWKYVRPFDGYNFLCCGNEMSKEAELVLAADYAALEAERDALRASLTELIALRDEVKEGQAVHMLGDPDHGRRCSLAWVHARAALKDRS